ncbi:DarT1-associated NADAR antitoxin family protein [Butyrivibrio sp. WCD3002]|uniref:DarT1-associated NADAR antitoxin family protein n=1 Tax=Butyrivibrio sp. WCD3002 TaxID=1280676 RepID=UPI00041C4197|nr:hypothetical protein [Butyrivibrio sp. WCD3002]
MAKRPVFIVKMDDNYIEKIDMEFTYYNGFSAEQKRKSIRSLHEEYRKAFIKSEILEISSKSDNDLGIQASAFNLKIKLPNDNVCSVESAFQGSKVFEKGGPYRDLLMKSSIDVKKDERLRSSGNITSFDYCGEIFDKEPKTLFYNWLYINALPEQHQLAEKIIQYDAFTDIEFNPKKSLNCQAEAAAIYVSLYRQGKIALALESKECFKQIVYTESKENPNYTQMTFF